MRKILFLTPTLACGGAARQLTLLAANLPRDRFQVRVLVLGVESPWAQALRQRGVEVLALGRRRAFDLVPFLNLRRATQEFQADVVHAWGPGALRLARFAGLRSPLIAGAVLPPNRAPDWLDLRLLCRADRVLALGEAEAVRYQTLGISPQRLVIAPPAVEAAVEAAGATAAHPAGRLIVALGPLEPYKGFRDAIWAIDILSYLYADLHLVLVGDGSERERLQAFAQASGAARRVRFAGLMPDPGPLLRQAALVWVPSRTAGGVNTALEAMAAGKPVVAANLPHLAEVVLDGETGLLFNPGDKPGLARQSRLILDDPARGRQLGAAGRRRAADYLAPKRLVEQAAALYE
jgi:glycosyltransferase involved in cell wall biosynthesis